MPEKPVIWIVDTSVFLNVLDVPGFNQNRNEVLDSFRSKIENKDILLLPFTSIIETGNHIAQLSSGDLRRRFAQEFAENVIASLDGERPWQPLGFPVREDIKAWLADFPNQAQSGKGMGDHIILKQWEEQKAKFPGRSVRIWSLDQHLQGYES